MKLVIHLRVGVAMFVFYIQIYNYDGGAAVFYSHTYNEEGGEAQCFLSKFYNE
jgi:hypothetical protein